MFFCSTGRKDINEKLIMDFWPGFVIHGEGEFYGNRAKQIFHFRNWLKDQKVVKQLSTTENTERGNNYLGYLKEKNANKPEHPTQKP
jgi:hypothetical protein